MLKRSCYILGIMLFVSTATSVLAVTGSLGPAENSWNGKTITVVASINAQGSNITQVEFQYSLGENVGFGGAGTVSIGTVTTQPYQVNWDSTGAVPNTDSEVFLYCRVTHDGAGAPDTDLPTRTIRVDNEVPQRPAIVDPSTNGTITGNTITITWLHGDTAYDNAAPVSISSVTNSGGKAQFTTAANHGLAVNETVTLTNLTDGNANGDYRVTSVPTATTFEVTTLNFIANGSGSAQRPAAGIYGFNIEVNQSATTELAESRNISGDEPDTVFFVGTTDGCYYIHAKTGDKNVNTNGRNWTTTSHFKITRDATPPTVDITDVDPDPRTTSVASIQIVFSEEVTNFDKGELALVGSTSGAISLAGAGTTLTSADNVTFTLGGDLNTLTNTDEQYTLTLSTGDIQDLAGSALAAGANDVWTKQQPAVSIGDVTMAEGDGGGNTNFDFQVTLDIVGAVSVNYTTVQSSALSTTDYTHATGTVTFASTRTKTVTVQVTADSVDESNETFRVQLSGVAGGTIADATGLGTITDDDTANITIANATVAENAGTVTVTVTKGTASGGAVSVDYDTQDNSAVSTSDYTSTSGTVSWADGLTGNRTFTVTITNDNLVEVEETFLALISNVTGNAAITDATGTVAITDDDTSGVRIIDGTVAENTGTMSVTVRKTGASQGTVSVDYDTADNSATSANDYTSTSGTVTWASGLSGDRTFTVTITNDSTAEPTETFTGLLSNLTGNATLADATANLEITDADTSGVRIIDGTVAENTGTMTVTVRKSGGSQGTVSVDYDTADNSATSANDYTSTSGTVTWASGLSGDRTFTVTITNDSVAEATETFTGLLSNLTGNATLADATANLEITDADTSGIRILDGTVAENTGTMTVTVRKSGVSQGTVSVDYDTADNSATSTNDYTSTSGTVTWASGLSGDRTFTVTITNDTTAEATETFTGLLSNLTGNATLADATANLEITDADTSGIRILDASVAENTGTMTVTVRKSGGSQGTVSVDYDTADNSATSTNDYTSTSGTVTWASGLSGDRTFTVTITNDTTAEVTETFTGLLSNLVGSATLADATANLEITDADTSGVRILDGTVAENTGTMTVTVRKSGVSQGTVSVDYDTADNSATSTNDYTSTSGTLTWASGLSGDRTFTVTITNDTAVEPTETFTGLLSNLTGNATLADATANLEITDADTSGIRILDGTVAENTGTMTVTVRKSGASQGTVSVDYDTADNSATSTNDYTSTSGTVTWASGLSGDRTFTVTITNDSTAEATETFTGLLSNLTGNATLADATANLEITDADTSGIRILDGTVAENTGTMTVTVRKSGVSQGTVSVDYDTADNSATSTNDYTSTSGTVTWASGLSGDRTFTVTITNDSTAEATETFTGLLSNLTGNATLADATANLEITDADTSGIRILDASVAENTGTMTVTVRKSGGSQGTVSVDYDTADNSATSTNDYTSTSGTVTWASGLSGDRTFTVTITNDSTAEVTETFTGLLSNLVGNATLADATANLEITDADTSGIRILDASVAENTGTMTVTVRKSGGSQGTVSVDYDTADNSATSTNDYTSTSGTVTWASGLSGDRTFTVTITNDTTAEATETFTGLLSNLVGNATLADATADLEITDADTSGIRILDASVAENTGTMTVTVRKSGGSQGTVSVDYDTADNSATSTNDYTSTSGTVTWASGLSGDRTFTVTITNDTTAEATETFTGLLSNLVGNATLADATADLEITDADTSGIRILDASVAENTGTMTVTVRKSGGSQGTVSVDYDTADNSATSTNDYTSTSGTVTWASGLSGDRTFTVTITNDTTAEVTETFTGLLSNLVGNSTLADATANLEITDADTSGIRILDGTVAENTGTMTVTVRKSGVSQGTVSVDYDTADNSATSTNDYTSTSGTLTWASGLSGDRTFTVTITNDTTVEPTETFTGLLSNLTGNATLADATANLEITDADTSGIRILDGTVAENTGTMTVTVRKSGVSQGQVSVDYDTADNSATSTNDYTSTSGTVSWASGLSGDRTFTVTITNDSVAEATETFTGLLSNLVGNATLADATADLEITDADTSGIRILDASVAENTGSMTVTVRKSGVSQGQVSVDYDTADNSATSTNDYTSTSGTVSWASGLSGDRTFTVTITTDSVAEATETFLGLLSNLVGNATLADATGDLEITDADTSGIRILDASVAENTGTMTVTVRKSGVSQGTVSVDYDTADNSATSTNDYTSTSGTVTWASGLSGDRTFTVTITNDTTAEPTETFTGLLSNLMGNATLADATGDLEITDADTSGIRILDASVAENTGTMTVTVRKSGVSQGTVSVDYDTADNSATSTNDYTSTSGTVTWASGLSGDRTFTVTITNDTTAEPTETFTGLLSNLVGNATLADATGDLEITDADTSGIRILDASVAENAGTMTVTIRKTGVSQGQVSVDYDTADNSATSTNDYTSTSGTVSWANGLSGDRTFSVTITNDIILETTETFLGLLSNVVGNATIADATGDLEITDEDTSGVRILDASVAESTGTMTVTVRKTGASQGTVSVDYRTSDNSATSTNDYTSTSGTLTWAEGLSGDRTFTVTITNDSTAEVTETFLGLLSNLIGNATLADATGNLEITDGDTSGIRILDASVAENTGTMTVTVRKTGTSQGQVSVDYDTADNSATSTNDYTSTSGTVSWASGLSGDRTFTVTITNDTLVEPTETFTGLLSNLVGNATLADATGDLEITDADTSGIRILDATVAENAGTMTVTVRKSGVSQGTVSVDYDTADNSAVSTTDYTSTSGTVSWASGLSGDRTFNVTISDDMIDETTETFLGLLSNLVGNATLADATANLEITDDDAATIVILDTSVNENAGTVTVTIRKTGNSSGVVSVDYNTADNTATSANDYTTTSGTVSWAALTSGDRTFVVSITDDNVAEASESFLGLIGNLMGIATITDPTGAITINDDDTADIRVLDGTVDESVGSVAITIRKVTPSQGEVSVDYDTQDSSAVSVADYTTTGGTVSWASGLTGDRSFTVFLNDDNIAEATESFLGLINNLVGNASIADATGVITITDDDTSGIRILDTSVAENTGTMTVTVRKTGVSEGQVSVDYDTADNSATSTNDYTSTSGTVSWADGLSGDRTFTVTITNDSVAEPTETFLGLIGNLMGNASISDATGDLEITDGDTSGIRILDATVAENAGTMTVTVRKTGVSSGQVSVDYNTADNSATSTNDYTSTSGTVSWADGLSGDRTFTVTITNDGIEEATETFLGLIGNLMGNASIADATGDLEITDDDTSGIRILDAMVAENTGTMTVTVRKTGSSQGQVSVDYDTADNSATSTNDYTSTSGTVSWADGLSGDRTFTVTITNDAVAEATETFLGLISNLIGNSSIADATGDLVITDGDTSGIRILDASVAEAAGTMTVTVRKSGVSEGQVSVDYNTADNSATSTNDYTSTSGTVSWADGLTGDRTFTVTITNDAVAEATETFLGLISNLVGNASIADATGDLEITDGDTSGIRILDATVAENTGTMTVTVRKTGVSQGQVSVDYDTADNSATSTNDYTSTSGTVSWADGLSGDRTFTVTITNDSIAEATETFLGLIGNLMGNASIADATGDLEITDADTSGIRILDASVSEDAGTMTVTIRKSGASSGQVSVDYDTSDLSATSTNDYTSTSGTVSWADGLSGDRTFTVTITDDDTVEVTETFLGLLSNVVGNATIADATGNLEITDEDTSLIKILDASVNEADGTVTVTIQKSGGNQGAVSVDYRTADSSAVSGGGSGDYTSTSGTVSWAALLTGNRTFTVTITNDSLDEDDETFLGLLSNVTGGSTICDATGVITIMDDDTAPTISIDDITVNPEGDPPGTTNGTFTVSLSAVSGKTITVDYATMDCTATSAGDYTSTSGTVTFMAGQTQRMVTIDVTRDTTPEYDESFKVILSNPSNATIADATGVATVIDDDNEIDYCIVNDDRREYNWVDVDIKLTAVALQSLLFSISYDGDDLLYNNVVVGKNTVDSNAEVAAVEDLDADGIHDNSQDTDLWVYVDANPTTLDIGDQAIAANLTQTIVLTLTFRVQVGAPLGDDQIDLTIGNVTAFGTTGEAVTITPLTNNDEIDVITDYNPIDVDESGSVTSANDGVYLYRALLYGDLRGLVPIAPEAHRASGQPWRASDEEIIANVEALVAGALGDSADVNTSGSVTAGRDGVYIYRRIRALADTLGDAYTVPAGHTGVAHAAINTAIDTLNANNTDTHDPHYAFSSPEDGPAPAQDQLDSNTAALTIRYNESLRRDSDGSVLTAASLNADGSITGTDAGGALDIGDDASAGGNDIVITIDAAAREITLTPNTAKGATWNAGGTVTINIDRADLDDVTTTNNPTGTDTVTVDGP